jgi:hypothetical protein
MSPLAQRA